MARSTHVPAHNPFFLLCRTPDPVFVPYSGLCVPANMATMCSCIRSSLHKIAKIYVALEHQIRLCPRPTAAAQKCELCLHDRNAVTTGTPDREAEFKYKLKG